MSTTTEKINDVQIIENINTEEYEKDEITSRIIDRVYVNVQYKNENDAPVSDEEIRAYIQRGNRKNPYTIVHGLDLVVDGEDIEISYDLAPVNFDRIRRITGYLVGTMDRWNNAKTAEQRDRVKHAVIR